MKYINKKIAFLVFMQKLHIAPEVWTTIREFSDYQVSTEGRVKNTKTGSILKNRTEGQRKSLRVSLHKENSCFKKNIENLVLENFTLEKKNLIEHKNKNGKDNRLCNLRYQKTPYQVSTGEFKTVSGYPDYLINEDGEIYSLKTMKFIKPQLSNKGYFFITISRPGDRSRAVFIHRLLAETFIENPFNFDCVNHIDANKLNNNVKNLEWCSIRENNIHARNLGLSGTPRLCKLKQEYIPIIKKMNEIGIPKSKIAKVFDVNASTISRIISGENWTDY